MQGISSALIASNESWVRRQAGALLRRVPSHVQKADLIQAGLIAVAQAALSFQHEDDHDTDAGREAFVRYARVRVKGAMIDELRQMDRLGRGQRRQVKALQIARERWRSLNGAEPSLGELSGLSSLTVEEIASLDRAALLAQPLSLSEEDDKDLAHAPAQPATPQDEVEARVDTAIVMRRLEKFFAKLPQRDRQVIDAYLGVGLTPVELAASLRLTPSRVSQIYKAVCARIAQHFGHLDHRALDHWPGTRTGAADDLVTAREAEMAQADGPWGALIEDVLTLPADRFDAGHPEERLVVDSLTRWG